MGTKRRRQNSSTYTHSRLLGPAARSGGEWRDAPYFRSHRRRSLLCLVASILLSLAHLANEALSPALETDRGQLEANRTRVGPAWKDSVCEGEGCELEVS